MNTDASKNSSQAMKLVGIEADKIKDKFPSLRFSEEVVYMISILQNVLKKKNCHSTGHITDLVAIQILSLIFYEHAEEIWENR